MSHSEYEGEPIRGLPERPPEGETLIWQGAPNWRSLARQAFHVRKVAAYFALIWLGFAIHDSITGAYRHILTAALWLLIPAFLAVAVLSTLAWLYARMTVYTITSRRLVIRSGIALPMSVNVPFKIIETADFKQHRDGTGDLPVRVERGQNTSFVVLWPNVRPWRFSRPEPMLRCIANPGETAQILSQALTASAEPEESGLPRIRKHQSAPEAAAPHAPQRAIA